MNKEFSIKRVIGALFVIVGVFGFAATAFIAKVMLDGPTDGEGVIFFGWAVALALMLPFGINMIRSQWRWYFHLLVFFLIPIAAFIISIPVAIWFNNTYLK